MTDKVCAMYFSGTGTTEKMACYIAKRLFEKISENLKYEDFDFTKPNARKTVKSFTKNDIVVLGMPVIAGRVPNLMLEYMNTIKGNGALGIPLVMYGNRNFDDALIELRNIMENDGFHTVAGAAFVGQHTFSTILGAGRPDVSDLKDAERFVNDICKKLTLSGYGTLAAAAPVEVDGNDPVGPYYIPRYRDGKPIDIRRVKPETTDECDNCGLCAELCPLGSINPENCREISGICMKCGACIKKCPKHAKYYGDKGLLYHKNDLEEMFGSIRSENKWFV